MAVKRVVTEILAGGQGTRLWPLTQYRAKPAVPIGGKFRLIDIPISNSLHGGIERVYVMTQFLSASLHRHIAQTYRFDNFSGGYVNILAAEQGLRSRDWYQGTADAVRQNMHRLLESDPADILILSGDQLYLMDVEGFVTYHRETEADLTIAVKPVTREEAPSLGCMRIDDAGRIVDFVEKPQDPAIIDSLALDEESIRRLGLDAEPGNVLASMGIYTFRTPILTQSLTETSFVDFGREIIPETIQSHRVMAHIENTYWRDIGTVQTFLEANLELTAPVPALNLYSPDRPIYTRPRFLPGCKVNRCDVVQSVLCDGSIITDAKVSDSIVGIRGRIDSGSIVERSIVMGGTYFPDEVSDPGEVPVGVGPNCFIRNSIIDLDARIGAGSQLTNESGIQHADAENYCIRDGIIVVPRSAEIPPGTVI